MLLEEKTATALDLAPLTKMDTKTGDPKTKLNNLFEIDPAATARDAAESEM